MTTINRCEVCANYNGDLKCLAFPNGIPKDILEGENDHSYPIEGQENNVVFSEKEVTLTPEFLGIIEK